VKYFRAEKGAKSQSFILYPSTFKGTLVGLPNLTNEITQLLVSIWAVCKLGIWVIQLNQQRNYFSVQGRSE
jgi:hypothetical protein